MMGHHSGENATVRLWSVSLDYSFFFFFVIVAMTGWVHSDLVGRIGIGDSVVF